MVSILFLAENSPETLDLKKRIESKGHKVDLVHSLDSAIEKLQDGRNFFSACLLLNSHALSLKLLQSVKQIKRTTMIPEVLIYTFDPTMNAVINLIKNGAYRVESNHPLDFDTLILHLHHIGEQFSLFDKAEKHCRKVMVDQMDYRLRLATEFVQKRRMDGRLFTNEEFYYFFPNADSRNASAIEIFRDAIEVQDESSSYRPTLLIVEDEPEYRKLLSDVFAKTGCTLLLAEDTPKALAYIQDPNIRIDAACLDIGLPTSRGDTLIEPIQKAHPTAEIVMLTGYDDIRTVTNCLDQQTFDYLIKPFVNEDLVCTMTRALQRSYFKRFLPDMGKYVKTQVNLSEDQKWSLLKDVADLRIFLEKPVTLKEVYFFFPEFCDELDLEDATVLSPVLFEKPLRLFQKNFLNEVKKMKIPV